MLNVINWFEIPSTDFDRAVEFYTQILGTPIAKGEFGGLPHGFLSTEDSGVSGAIVQGNGQPSMDGALVYLNAKSTDNMDAILNRVEAAGGKVLMARRSISPQGYMGIIRDTEGNRIAFHTPENG